MLAVLNPGGRDPIQAFPDGAGEVDDTIHPPVNYHGYAACQRGIFCRSVCEIPAEIKDVILLLRGDFKEALKPLQKLKAEGRAVAVAFKEAGVHQVADKLSDAKRVRRFLEICGMADLALASTPELVPLFRGAGVKKVKFIPTPYPIEDPRWDFSVPTAEQRGLFIGTREFDVPPRQHAATLISAREIARQTGEPVTVLNLDGRKGRAKLEAMQYPGNLLKIEDGDRPYREYLQLIARHRLVFQLDHSAVPGQVAGDALLCRIPCLGGDGAVDRLIYTSVDPVREASRLLTDETARQAVLRQSQIAAHAKVSYASVSAMLQALFGH